MEEKELIPQAPEEEEYWDIYDSHKQVTGRLMKRNDWILRDGEYHLSVLGVIRREDGHFLITRRVLSKHWAPGWWEVPGGGARAGETSYEAVVREVREETGLDVSGCSDREPVLTYHRENPGEGDNYFVDVYRFVLPFEAEDIRLQTSESLEFEIADLDRIRQLDQEGIFLHYQSIRSVLEG